MRSTTIIYVLTNGWVVVGQNPVPCEGKILRLSNAHTIRRWGTTEGLGELFGGPLESTKLDKLSSDLTINTKAVIMEFEVDTDKWGKHFA